MTNKVNIAVVTISVGSETMFALLIVDCYVQTDIKSYSPMVQEENITT